MNTIENMICECAGQTDSRAILQTYTTPAGQQLTVPVFTPEQITVYVRVYVNQLVDDVTAQSMKDTIATLAAQRTIGERLTSADILELLTHNYENYAFAGCQVSLDDLSYAYQVTPEEYQLVIFDSDNMQIIGDS